MKSYIYKLILILPLLLWSCSNDDDPEVSTINVSSLRVINQSGQEVMLGDCVDPTVNYLVEITTTTLGSGEVFEPISVQYTFNGALFSMTFTEIGVQRNSISLVTGQNTLQLVESGAFVTVNLVAPTDFELVF